MLHPISHQGNCLHFTAVASALYLHSNTSALGHKEVVDFWASLGSDLLLAIWTGLWVHGIFKGGQWGPKEQNMGSKN